MRAAAVGEGTRRRQQPGRRAKHWARSRARSGSQTRRPRNSSMRAHSLLNQRTDARQRAPNAEADIDLCLRAVDTTPQPGSCRTSGRIDLTRRHRFRRSIPSGSPRPRRSHPARRPAHSSSGSRIQWGRTAARFRRIGSPSRNLHRSRMALATGPRTRGLGRSSKRRRGSCTSSPCFAHSVGRERSHHRTGTRRANRRCTCPTCRRRLSAR